MKIISIDTSTCVLSVGACVDRTIYEYNLMLGTRLSVLLIPTLKSILDALKWGVRDIDYFACGIGPGSFTGLRIGVAAIKGLAWPLQKPVIAISSLDILARSAPATGQLVVPVVDAKRNLVYSSVYRVRHNSFRRLQPYSLCTLEQLCKKIPKDCILLGDAVNKYRDVISSRLPRAIVLDKDCWYPQGHNAIALASEKIRQRKVKSAFTIEPMYLYPKECQIKAGVRGKGQGA